MSANDETQEREEATSSADPLEPALRHAFGMPTEDTRGEARDPVGEETLTVALAASGRYALREEIGRGGMGVVFRAHDGHLRREVAIKVLYWSTNDSERVGRFAEEARIAAQLQHPGIVPIHDLGRVAGRPFITMKLVAGRTLHQELVARRGTEAEGSGARATAHHLGILEHVAQAVGFAHERGVVHRDLKPANVMLGPAGEVQVMDWGLAKVVGSVDPAQEVATGRGSDPRLVSLAGRVMGTPAYMSPEQARGEVANVDLRSDVFALGAMLFEILLQRPVYRGTTSTEVRGQAAAASTDEALAELDAGGFEPELVALARSCLAADPELRPRDAGAVAHALAAHRDAVEERAERARTELRVAEARSRHERSRRKLATALAAAVALGLLAIGGALWWRDLEQRGRQTGTSRQVTAARERAEGLLVAARTATETEAPAAWKEARAAALQTAAVARAGEADAALRSRTERWATRIGDEADERLAALDAASRDREMITRLDRIRLERTLPPDPVAIGRAYERAFQAYGLDLQAPDAARHLSSSPIAARLLSALDDWIVHGRHYQGVQDPRFQALRQMLTAADDDPLRSRVRTALFDRNVPALRELGRSEEALALPSGLLQLLASALHVIDAEEVAIRLLRRACYQRPGAFYLAYDLAHYLNIADPPRSREALGWFNAALALKDHRVVRAERALALVMLSRYDEALAEGALMERRFPDSTTPWLIRGRIHRNRDEEKEAVAAFEQCIARDAQDYAARISLGNLYWEQGRLDEAEPLYLAARENGAPPAQIHYLLGNLERKRGGHERAANYFRQAIGFRQQYQQAWHQLALTLADLDRLEQAITAMRHAVEILPSDAAAHHNLGHFLRQACRFDEARVSYERAIALSSTESGNRSRYERALRQVDLDEDNDELIAEILAGESGPPAEGWLPLVQHCMNLRHPAKEASLWRHVEATDRELLDDLSSGAAGRALTAAAHAAAGRGLDAAGRTAAQRSEDSALARRMADRLLGLVEQQSSAGERRSRFARRALEQLLDREELAPFRGPQELPDLEPEEHAAWAAFFERAARLAERLDLR